MRRPSSFQSKPSERQSKQRTAGGLGQRFSWGGVPTDEEDLEIRISLILPPQHSDIWIHLDEQVHNTKVVV